MSFLWSSASQRQGLFGSLNPYRRTTRIARCNGQASQGVLRFSVSSHWLRSAPPHGQGRAGVKCHERASRSSTDSSAAPVSSLMALAVSAEMTYVSQHFGGDVAEFASSIGKESTSVVWPIWRYCWLSLGHFAVIDDQDAQFRFSVSQGV